MSRQTRLRAKDSINSSFLGQNSGNFCGLGKTSLTGLPSSLLWTSCAVLPVNQPMEPHSSHDAPMLTAGIQVDRLTRLMQHCELRILMSRGCASSACAQLAIQLKHKMLPLAKASSSSSVLLVVSSPILITHISGMQS